MMIEQIAYYPEEPRVKMPEHNGVIDTGAALGAISGSMPEDIGKPRRLGGARPRCLNT